jgi:hypothetical protein
MRGELAEEEVRGGEEEEGKKELTEDYPCYSRECAENTLEGVAPPSIME